MRTFVTCALLAAIVAMFGTTSAQAYDGYRYYYHRRPVAVIVAPPVVLAPAPSSSRARWSSLNPPCSSRRRPSWSDR